jgi:chromate transporter
MAAHKHSVKTLLTLFITFAKIGLFTFGGGYAMLPMMTRVITNQKKWATEEELLNFYAVSQCTPGIIAVNTATFIGAKQKGIPGAIFATLGMIFPSLIIITLIAVFLQNFENNQIIQNAFTGIKIAACALITAAVFKLGIKVIKSIATAGFAVIAFLLTLFLGVSPAFIAIGAGVLGALYAVAGVHKESGK